MTVSTGSFTVGSGGTYATWKIAFDDIAGGGLTGNLTFTQISDLTDAGAINTSAAPIALGGFTLTMTSNTAHNGSFNAGWLWARNNNPYKIECDGTGTLEISDIRVDGTGGLLELSPNVGAALDIKFHDVLMQKGSTDTGSVTIISRAGGFEFYNNVIANMASTLSGAMVSLQPIDPTAPIRVFNNDVHTTGVLQIGFSINPANQVFTDLDIANNVAVCNGGPGWAFTGTASASLLAGMVDNATTDASSLTGTTTPVQGYTPATEFKSIIFGGVEFLNTAVGQLFEEAGTATNNPTTVDVRGLAYGSSPPIGAYTSEALLSTSSGHAPAISISIGIP